MKQLNYVGIDVSAKNLVAKVELSSGQIKLATFENTMSGFQKLLKYSTKGGKRARVCMEATGIYHFNLAVFLAKQKNAAVMIVNPKAIKHFAIAKMQRGKTDPLDADVILKYLKCMDFKPWILPSEDGLKLQTLSRRIFQLKTEILRENNRKHAAANKDITENIISNDIKVNIRHLEKRITLLEKKAIEIIEKNQEIKTKFDLLCSIKGISTKSAIQILSELLCMPPDMTPEQWVAHAGLDPKPVESGSSINKPRHITKTGNKYLRTALYMPAWVAVHHSEPVKKFYEMLISKGKEKLQAIVAVMRKLLHAIWGIFNSSTKWDEKRFYNFKKA